jgi:hypothetical protein
MRSKKVRQRFLFSSFVFARNLLEIDLNIHSMESSRTPEALDKRKRYADVFLFVCVRIKSFRIGFKIHWKTAYADGFLSVRGSVQSS